MEANVFISKIKADGSKNDITKLDEVYREYKTILAKIADKERGLFSLNVLCILCRNLEKVASWRTAVNNKDLLTLSIDCVRETRSMSVSDRVKALACIYHIHRHVVRQDTTVAPELILKLSYMAFESEPFADYAKTYWNIIADRIFYIERLKTKVSITKLLPKLSEDIYKTIKIFNTVQFCQTVLTFLVRKMHYLFHDNSLNELIKLFDKVFEEIARKGDLKSFKKLSDKDMIDLYVKLNDCLYVIAEDCTRAKSQILAKIIQTCILLVGHSPDLLHCLQTIYLNGFCSILSSESSTIYAETLLENYPTTFETTEKLGYTKAMTVSYPYVTQLLRIYLENSNGETLTEATKTAVLKLMQFLFTKLKNCQQILKCENCKVQSGLHEAIRLSFLSKNLISKDGANPKVLSHFYAIVLSQYNILKTLCGMGCTNYEKCYKKLQSDIHNTAITLNKLQSFEYSIKLFKVYLKNEIVHFKNETDMKNISRALYNKSICELDAKNYETALSDAYLSLVFAYPEGLTTEKYMSLVMDIKAKVLKTKDDDLGDDNSVDDVQMMTVLDVCADAVESQVYGNLKPFFCDLKFSELLKHEFDMYAKLWPSVVPIGGVCRTLCDLMIHDVPWINAKDDLIQRTLYEVVLLTPNAVRSIHKEILAETVTSLVDGFQDSPAKTTELNLIYATLLLLKADYDVTDASHKYTWKCSESTIDPDKSPTYRTISQEYDAIKSAIKAVDIFTVILKDIHTVPKSPILKASLNICKMSVALLLHLYNTAPGLQLAYICCVLAELLGDKELYIQSASTIIYHASKQSQELTEIITKATKYCMYVIHKSECMETALIFLCDCAKFYNEIGSTGMSAKLLQIVQAKLIDAYEKNPEINLELACGRLLEAQWEVCSQHCTSPLAAVMTPHRHYLTVTNSETKYSDRRWRALTLKLHITYSGLQSTIFARNLLSWRRARSAGGATLPAAAAPAQGMLFAAITNTSLTDDAQIKIDRRLKYIIGLQSPNDHPITIQTEVKKQNYPQRQELETMLENMTFKTQTSPTVCPLYTSFKLPEFLTHDNCNCYACSNKYTAILTCQTIGLEASMYFRAKRFDIAQNYFEGALKCCFFTEKVLKKEIFGKYERFLVDLVDGKLYADFKKTELEILVEAAFFELARSDFKTADVYVVRIHEVLQENVKINLYLRNEVLNLMAASANKRKTEVKQEMANLEVEFDNLQLSPAKAVDPAKTPEAKAKKPPTIERVKVSDEEIPKIKRKGIKLNWDEKVDENETSNKKTTRHAFKIPVPIIAKPALESITPTPRRRNPEILISQPSIDISTVFATPQPKSKSDDTEFFTPTETPEQFFTPMTSIKTYTKKSLRQGIVKNLESEFSTPKSVKKDTVKEISKPTSSENIQKESKTKSKTKLESGSVKTLKDKRTLKRATSPGKLEKNDKPARSSRLRQPAVKLNVDDK